MVPTVFFKSKKKQLYKPVSCIFVCSWHLFINILFGFEIRFRLNHCDECIISMFLYYFAFVFVCRKFNAMERTQPKVIQARIEAIIPNCITWIKFPKLKFNDNLARNCGFEMLHIYHHSHWVWHLDVSCQLQLIKCQLCCVCKKDKHVTKATRVELCSCWLLRENITLSSVCVCVIREKNISYCIWMQSSISQRSQQSVVLLVTVQMLWKWDSILFNSPIGNISFGCHLHAWKKRLIWPSTS